MVNKRKRILSYATYGFILGLFFPIAATSAELINLGAKLTASTVRVIHLGHPLMFDLPQKN